MVTSMVMSKVMSMVMSMVTSPARTGCAAVLGVLVLAVSAPNSHAVTRWSGDLSSEYTRSEMEDSDTYLFQSYLGISARPPRKRLLDTRLHVRLSYFDVNGRIRRDTNPFASLGVRIAGDGLRFEIERMRSANLTSTGQLADHQTDRLTIGLTPADWPRFSATITDNDTRIGDSPTQTNRSWNVSADHTVGNLFVHGGYYRLVQNPGPTETRRSENAQAGLNFRHQLAPATQLDVSFDVDRHSTRAFGTISSVSMLRTYRTNLNSRPAQWLSFNGGLLDETTTIISGQASDYNSGSYDLTGSLYPWMSTRLFVTAGNRHSEDSFEKRDVDYLLVGSTWIKDFSSTVDFSVSGSHTREDDPQRGRNVRDYVSLNYGIYVSPSTRARLLISTTHNSVPGFVDTARYDAIGSFADRDLYDDAIEGFTYYASDLGLVYTKDSPVLGSWTNGVVVEIPTLSQYRTTVNLQLDGSFLAKSRFSLHYSRDAQDDRLSFDDNVNSSWSGSLTYQTTRRTSFSLNGVLTRGLLGPSRSSWTASLNTTTLRRHRIGLSYSERDASILDGSQLSLNLSMSLSRGSNFDVIGSLRDPFRSRADAFWRARYSQSF